MLYCLLPACLPCVMCCSWDGRLEGVCRVWSGGQQQLQPQPQCSSWQLAGCINACAHPVLARATFLPVPDSGGEWTQASLSVGCRMSLALTVPALFSLCWYGDGGTCQTSPACVPACLWGTFCHAACATTTHAPTHMHSMHSTAPIQQCTPKPSPPCSTCSPWQPWQRQLHTH